MDIGIKGTQIIKIKATLIDIKDKIKNKVIGANVE
jgi:hypothetical protein